jgi:cobalamin biosynthesis protein CbiG
MLPITLIATLDNDVNKKVTCQEKSFWIKSHLHDRQSIMSHSRKVANAGEVVCREFLIPN